MHSFTESLCLPPTKIFTYRQRPLKPINFSKNQQTLQEDFDDYLIQHLVKLVVEVKH